MLPEGLCIYLSVHAVDTVNKRLRAAHTQSYTADILNKGESRRDKGGKPERLHEALNYLTFQLNARG